MTENVQNSTFETTNNKWLDVWNEFKNHKGALAGAIIFALIVILVLLGPFVWPYEANGINIRIRKKILGVKSILETVMLCKNEHSLMDLFGDN